MQSNRTIHLVDLLGSILGLLLFLMIGGVGILALRRPADQPVKRWMAQLNPVSQESEPDYIPQPLSFQTVFETDPSWVATLSAQRVTTLLATGDVLLARTVNSKTVKANDFLWPWQKTASILQTADLTFINLETPLPKDCEVILGGFSFCGDQRHVQGLTYAGVDVINLANNHAGNHGHEGVEETLDLLRSNNFLVSGVDGPVYTQVHGQTFAFLGFNEVDVQPGIALADSELVAQQVAEARAQADVVIVEFHWGIEYTYQPSTNQRRLAHLAIDNGADVIIGNHPHWFQALEQYRGKFITYSHGNFIFDQMWSQETREGIVGRYTFYDDQLINVEFLPVLIEDFGQPRWLEGEDKQRILETLKTATDQWGKLNPN